MKGKSALCVSVDELYQTYFMWIRLDLAQSRVVLRDKHMGTQCVRFYVICTVWDQARVDQSGTRADKSGTRVGSEWNKVGPAWGQNGSKWDQRGSK